MQCFSFRKYKPLLLFIATITLARGAGAAGLMSPTQSALPDLKIKSHHVNVLIEDGYAITTIDQTFSNPNDIALEAIYSFPVPAKAAVGEFTYWIDGKPVVGEVMEKKQARDLYEQEKSQGRESALAEQDEYRSFDMSVYPLQPQSDVRIRLVYVQAVHAELGIGRYVYPLEDGGVDEQKLAFWNYNEVVEEAFSFNLRIRSSYPLDDIRVPAQPHAVIQRESDQVWTLALNNAALTAENGEGQATPATVKAPAARLDQDVVVYWRHQAGLPAAIDMVSYRPQGASKGTFMMTVTPGDDLGAITGGRDWVFVLDYSGSMVGKYQSLIEGVGEGLERLNPQDRFRIVLFNQEAREITRGFVPATPETVSRYVQQLEQIVPSGGTNLYAGLALGYTGLDADRPAAVILVSDGVANVGVIQKKSFLQLLERYDVRLYSVVMGNSANRPLLEGMAKVSNGFAVSVSNADDIAGLLMQTADKLSHEAYRDLELSIRGVKTGDLTPSNIGTLYRGQQLIVLGHYWGDGQAELTLTGRVSSETKTYRSPLYFPESDELNPELERLWAYASIEQLQDQIDYLGEDADFKNAIIDLALEYGLVTDYTSMIVVRDEVFQQLGIDRKNTRRVERELAARQKRDTTATRTHRQDASQPAFDNISGNNTRAYPSGRGGSLGPYTLLLLLLVLLLRRWLPQDLSASGAGADYRVDAVCRSADTGHRDQA